MLLTSNTHTFHPHLISWLFVALEIVLLSYQVFCFYQVKCRRKSLIAFLLLILAVIWNCTVGYTSELALMVFVNIVVLLITILLMLIPLVYFPTKSDRPFNAKLPDSENASDMPIDHFLNNCGRYQLSPREIEIVLLIRNGLTYRAIAESLHISESTVDTHMQNIYSKVGERGKIALLNKLEH